jgi:hypothetical protein
MKWLISTLIFLSGAMPAMAAHHPYQHIAIKPGRYYCSSFRERSDPQQLSSNLTLHISTPWYGKKQVWFSYDDGVPGRAYPIKPTAVGKGNTLGFPQDKTKIFVDYSDVSRYHALVFEKSLLSGDVGGLLMVQDKINVNYNNPDGHTTISKVYSCAKKN